MTILKLPFHNTGRPRRAGRHGAVVVLAAVMMVVLLAMVAFAIDSGYMANTRTELQRAADAGAMAGAAALVQSNGAAQNAAWEYVQMNRSGSRTIARNDVTIDLGRWDKTSRSFTVDNSTSSAVRVRITQPGNAVFFGRVLGRSSFTAYADAVATYKPRDIMMALDYSASMNFDSQLRSIDVLGRTTVENYLRQMHQDLGSPTYGSMQFTPQYINSTSSTAIKNALGLGNVAYPYPGGSWSDYFDYVQNDSDVSHAGYQKKYGYLTWLDYLQSKQYSNADTPDLWKTSEQPITAMKDAVDLFISYIQAHSPDDQMGLSIYTASDYTAVLEKSLTQDFASVATTVRQRQAGHYVGGTNIYDGMKKARLELQNNARSGALKLMILMTDGYANLPGSATQARNYVLQEARDAAAAGIKIIAIALGSDADTALMEEVASISGGASFIIPGGRSASEYQEDLEEVFKQVAADRPLELVQ